MALNVLKQFVIYTATLDNNGLVVPQFRTSNIKVPNSFNAMYFYISNESPVPINNLHYAVFSSGGLLTVRPNPSDFIKKCKCFKSCSSDDVCETICHGVLTSDCGSGGTSCEASFNDQNGNYYRPTIIIYEVHQMKPSNPKTIPAEFGTDTGDNPVYTFQDPVNPGDGVLVYLVGGKLVFQGEYEGNCGPDQNNLCQGCEGRGYGLNITDTDPSTFTPTVTNARTSTSNKFQTIINISTPSFQTVLIILIVISITIIIYATLKI